MRPLRVEVTPALAYWTVVDDDWCLVPAADAFLRHLRLGRDRAVGTTKAYAGDLALFLGWCADTGRDLPGGARSLSLFVAMLKTTPIERAGAGQGKVRSAGRINHVLAAVRENFRYIAGGEATYGAFQQGEFDVAFLSELVVTLEAREAGDLGFEALAGSLTTLIADQGVTGRADSPFKDVRVREAMQLAGDYDVINERLFNGIGIASSAIIPDGAPMDPGVERPPYDPDRAADLVEELKTEGAWGGTIDLLVPNTPLYVEMTLLLEGMWEAVGIDVTVEQGPPDVAARRVNLEPNFEVASAGFILIDPCPWSTLNQLVTGSPRARSGFSSPAMDGAVELVRAASDIDETRAAMAEVQQVWNEEFPQIVWNHSIYGILVADGVHGMEYESDATPYFCRARLE
ncbi:MAG: ABC transporter substrate-binding protein [Acidimicrobiales bacterium]